MDTTFISCLLLFSLVVLLIMYLYQTMPETNNKNNKNNKNKISNKKETFLPIIWDTCKNARTTGMPVHRVGPVYNFHQHFNKYSPLITGVKNASSIGFTSQECDNANKDITIYSPTGIPEMGWRNWYLQKYSKNEIREEDPFNGTDIRTFLNNMENVNNLYRKCN